MNILELPEDVLSIIFLFLDAPDFINLCSTCKVLHNEFRQDSTFWRTKTSNTFRLPISPLLKADGARWYWLYKRLKTQTKLYTWGQGLHGNLGRGRAIQPPRVPIFMRPPPRQRPMVFDRTSSNWPTETDVPTDIGIIADLQCGGWSTSVLNAQGKLYCTGSIDSADGRTGPISRSFTQLEYLTQSTTAISQFSSGRKHVLALTDHGEILSWDRVNAKGLKIFSNNGNNFGGRPTRVVAGWVESSAYIPEVGIVYWNPVRNDQRDQMLDGIHVPEMIVPGTAHRKHADGNDFDVPAHILLEGYLLWITSDSKVLACSANANVSSPPRPPPLVFEVPGYRSSNDEIQDIQGSFRRFVVFTKLGRVLAGSVDYVRRSEEVAGLHEFSDGEQTRASSDPTTWPELNSLLAQRPKDIRALQHSAVVKVAFGDYHYHALHANGRITSHGTDSQSCGQLGLGDTKTTARFRGVTSGPGMRPDGQLLPIAELKGRQVWFEPEKKDWLSWMSETLQEGSLTQEVEGETVSATHLLMHDPNRQGMFSEWVEREGRHWDQGPLDVANSNNITSEAQDKGITHASSDDYSHLDAYFAISVSAAGWHSGALVLVDQDKAWQVREKWMTTITHDQPEEELHTKNMPGHFEAPKAQPGTEYIWKGQGFPKVTLPDGFELPGVGQPRPWRDGMPLMQELSLEGLSLE